MDARRLLKEAKSQRKKVPVGAKLVANTAQLVCSVCGVQVKQHLWDTHLKSQQHLWHTVQKRVRGAAVAETSAALKEEKEEPPSTSVDEEYARFLGELEQETGSREEKDEPVDVDPSAVAALTDTAATITAAPSMGTAGENQQISAVAEEEQPPLRLETKGDAAERDEVTIFLHREEEEQDAQERFRARLLQLKRMRTESRSRAEAVKKKGKVESSLGDLQESQQAGGELVDSGEDSASSSITDDEEHWRYFS